jgi:phosphatidylglycerophosphate synthase
MRRQALSQCLLVSLLLTLLMIATQSALRYPISDHPAVFPAAQMVMTSLALWALVVTLAWRGLARHDHHTFGMANTVTLMRAAGTSLLAGLIPVASHLALPAMGHWLWMATLLVVLLIILDGVDGYLARVTCLASPFGARFDMEIDALLALVISMVLWRTGEVGLWILGLGIMRYAFVFASIWFVPLRGQLFPSFRRKSVCVIQLVALCAILSPLIEPPVSQALGAVALACLAGSFGRDIHWLYRSHAHTAAHSKPQHAAPQPSTQRHTLWVSHEPDQHSR